MVRSVRLTQVVQFSWISRRQCEKADLIVSTSVPDDSVRSSSAHDLGSQMQTQTLYCPHVWIIFQKPSSAIIMSCVLIWKWASFVRRMYTLYFSCFWWTAHQVRSSFLSFTVQSRVTLKFGVSVQSS